MNVTARRIAATLAIALSCAPLAARGEGVVALSDPRVPQYREALEGALQGLGSTAPAMVDSLAADAGAQLKVRAPGVILAVGLRALQLAQEAAPETPVVYCMVLGRSATRTKQLTGVPLEVSGGEQLARFRQLLPRLKRLGVLFDPAVSGPTVAEAQAAAKGLGIALVSKEIADPKQVRAAAEALVAEVDGVWLPADPRLVTKDVFNFLLELTLEKRVPLFGFLESFTRAGALASVVPDYRDIGVQAGRLAAELAARAPEKRVPVPAAARSAGALTLNQRVAEKLGLALPQEALQRARTVFR